MSFAVPADAYGQFMGRFSEPLAQRFAAYLRLAAGQRVLDVGCGPGALTAVLAAEVGQDLVSAIDPSDSFVAAARTRLPGADVRSGVAESLPWPDGTFDRAAAQLVVHFMTDPVAGLAEMARVTRPGGTAAATVWDFGGGTAPLSLFWRAAKETDPAAPGEADLPGTREGQLADLLRQAGLRDIDSTVLTVSLEFMSFEEWWDPFTFGVGPAGGYLAGLDDRHRSAVRDACARLLPPAPFTLTVRSWTARGLALPVLPQHDRVPLPLPPTIVCPYTRKTTTKGTRSWMAVIAYWGVMRWGWDMSDDSPAVRVRGLVKSYGSVHAVRGIDLEIRHGEIFALLGPNGAGKTTTVEILEGYRSRDGGEVSVLGHDPGRERSKILPHVGIVLQKTGVDPYLTVAETVAMFASYYPRPRSASEVVDLVGLGEKRDSRVTTLSGGQLRRLDMAVALAGDPDLLFLDEPTTGFDPSARREAWEVVKNLASLGKTVLLTTHYMDEAQYLADRVAVIAAGHIVATGPPSTLAHRDQAAARIRYRTPEGTALPDGLGGTPSGDGFTQIASANVVADLHRLTGWALDNGIALDGLEVSRPTLEDVYLSLTDGAEQTVVEQAGGER
jgi:ABC-2 type transport system ATP-binding protein